MNEETALLSELMLQADVFCGQIEDKLRGTPKTDEQTELRLKIGQGRGALSELQEAYNQGHLRLSSARVRADFRSLIIALLWIAFRAKQLVDFRLFRKLVQIESGFTFLLTNSGRWDEEKRS